MGRRTELRSVAAGLLTAASIATALSAVPARAQDGGNRPSACPCVGPTNGTVVIAGGGDLPPEIYRAFVRAAGGPNSRIVVIPTAGEREDYSPNWDGLEPFLLAGSQSVHVLHTRSRTRANEEGFVAPLQRATGVWITGGRQWRLTDAYLGTRVAAELRRVLERGGVVGGTSAGASVLASYLVRGTKDGRLRPNEPGDDVGFGLLRDVAVDQHLLARQREGELVRVLDAYPQLLGLGLDEGTALVIRGDTARVEGASVVGVYDRRRTQYPHAYRWLARGESYDLRLRRRIVRLDREPTDIPSFMF